MLSNVAPAPEEPKTVDRHFMIYPPAYTYGFVVLRVLGGGGGGGNCLLRSFGRQKYFLGNSSWHMLYLMMGFCDVFRWKWAS